MSGTTTHANSPPRTFVHPEGLPGLVRQMPDAQFDMLIDTLCDVRGSPPDLPVPPIRALFGRWLQLSYWCEDHFDEPDDVYDPVKDRAEAIGAELLALPCATPDDLAMKLVVKSCFGAWDIGLDLIGEAARLAGVTRLQNPKLFEPATRKETDDA
jgi:hypothetical protein